MHTGYSCDLYICTPDIVVTYIYMHTGYSCDLYICTPDIVVTYIYAHRI